MRDMATSMKVKLTRAEDSALVRAPTSSVEAYRAYLEGRFHWAQRSEDGLQRAVEKFTRAIELDPGFALAHAALADAHTTRGYLGFIPPVATFPVARPYALKALELDPSLAQAHAALGYIKFYFDWDWAGAREEFRKAIALDPADPTSRQWHAVYLLAAGHSEEAFREVQEAHRLDPLSLAINTDIGFHHYYNGRYPEAVAQLKSVLEMKGDFLLAHLWLARTYLALGRFDEALAETAFAEGKAREWPVLVTARGFTYGATGKREEARAVLAEMETLAKKRFVTAYGMALIHAGLDQKDEAFHWLGKAFDERSHWLVWLRLDPRWKNIRDDPRFAPLVARMRYPT
jgi:tetratricopeptide (TPR) repeat protein